VFSSIWLKKSFSQHLLKDVSFAKRIVDSMNIGEYDSILEIGPGGGALTEWLIKSPVERIMAVELDKRFYPFLTARFGQDDRFHLIENDFLKMDLHVLISTGKKLRIVGNLPYAITTPILFRILDNRSLIDDLIVTVQKEVAERIVSCPGTKVYGIPSVFFQLYSNSEILFNIPRNAFFPVPKVDSAVLKISFREEPLFPVHDTLLFQQVVKTVFQQRRKMLKNTLKRFVQKDDVLDRVPLDLSRRPETLTVFEFVQVSNFLAS